MAVPRKKGSGGYRPGAGRPKVELNPEELEKLCAIQCTDEEIAAWFGVSTKTIADKKKDPEYAEFIERGRAKGRISVRRLQMQAAEAGNPALLIWLGKQTLGQRDMEREARVSETANVAKVEVEWVVPKPEPSEEKLPMIPFQANGDSTRAN